MEKIVKFDEWCDKCKYYEADPAKNDNPCNNCLAVAVNMDSKKPIFWVDKDGKKGPWLSK